jgi:hypothetical protein
MQIEVDMKSAADRHYADAQHLLKAKRIDGAGYHFGFAAECAIKLLMQRAGMSEARAVTIRGESQKGAYYEHFPELQAALLQQADGRMASRLTAIACHKSFLQGWSEDALLEDCHCQR